MNNRPTEDGPEVPEDEGTGIPGLGNWRQLYIVVFACFAAYVVILTIVTRAYAP